MFRKPGDPAPAQDEAELEDVLVEAPAAEVAPAAEEAWRDALRARPEIDLVASFGTALHVSGRDAARLDACLAELLQGSALQTNAVPASLEDAFIYLMQSKPDPLRG